MHAAYAKRRKQANGVMDFDDLLNQWLRLLRDEYQDTNKHVQCQLIDLLGGRHQNVMAWAMTRKASIHGEGPTFEHLRISKTLSGGKGLQDRDQLPQHS